MKAFCWMLFLFIMTGLAPEDSHWRILWFTLFIVSVCLSASKPSKKALEELEEEGAHEKAVQDIPDHWKP